MSQNSDRPLSPHLQVYRPQMTSMMSILHRATGYALAVGTVMIVWLLIAAATGPDAYAVFTGFTNSLIGRLLVIGWSFALYYHLCNGIRHLFWDMGYLFKLKDAFAAGYLVWGVSIALTVVTWWVACPWSSK